MKRIVRGNDFTMRIPVVKIVEGEKVAFPLPGCTDIMVRLCSAYRRLELAYTIDAKEDNVIVARVEGDRIPLGTYALEVRGKIFGNDWRSNEYEQVAIVDRNADGDTELGSTDEGENSVEMDTAVVVLPPDRELEALVKEALAQNKAMSELSDTIKASEEGRAKSEELRAKSEEARAQAELTRASNEAERVQAEQVRENNEGQRLAAEQGRVIAENARADAETARVEAEAARVTAESARVDAENARTEAEAARQEAEKKREASEVTRTRTETERETNEQARQANETTRQTAEEKRESDTATAIASMDEHRSAFDDAEAARVSNEQARQEAETERKEAESERGTQEQARVKNEEGRVKSENARAQAEAERVKAEAKRAEDIGQAVSKANAASEVAVTANEPFVWEPFKDLEHWNITAMDLATGTVTLDTEEHGLAVGDLVTLAANIGDWVHNYKLGRSWEYCMASSRMAGNFPVKQRGAIPAAKVTAVNGAEIQCDGLKVSTNIVPVPSDWQLQRCATAGRSVALPARFKGKPVTVTVEGQYVRYSTDWCFYHARTVLHDDKGNAIFPLLGDALCGLPFVKQTCSMRSGHIELTDIGVNVYGEDVALGSDTSLFYSSNKTGAWDIGQATNLYMEKVLGHYATRVIVEPYRELTKLGGVSELEQMQALKRQWFAANAMIAREYWLPTYSFFRDYYEYEIPMRSGFYCKVKVLNHEATMCIVGGYTFSSAESSRALNYLWVKDGHLAYNPAIGTGKLEQTDYVFDDDWHEVYVSWGDTWDKTWIDGTLVMEHENVTCRRNATSKIYVFGYNALDHRTNVPPVGAAVIQGPVLLFWDGEVKAWHCGLSAKEDDDTVRSTLMSCPTMHTYNGSIHDGQGGCPSADCTGLIHCEGTGNRAWVNIFGTWKEI